MPTQIQLHQAGGPLGPAALPVDPASLLEVFLGDKKPTTVEAYASDFGHFARWAGLKDGTRAVSRLVTLDRGRANAAVLQYRAAMLAQGLAPATVNRRLAALRSVVKLARVVGLCHFELDVPGVRATRVKDSRGPKKAEVARVLESLTRPRDVALVRLLFDVALRRGEVSALDVEDVVLEADGKPCALLVIGKGKREKERVDLPTATADALAAWLEQRGLRPGPLFCSLTMANWGARLSGGSIYDLVRRLGEKVGVRLRPHGLRHSAVTEAVRACNGDAFQVQKFSRHADLRTVTVYVDRVMHPTVEVAERVAL